VLQIDGSKRKLYLKFLSVDKMYSVLQETGGTQEYYHESGEISNVVLELAGMGVRKMRLVNLSPEAPDSAIRAVLSSYGDVRRIVEERWARPYRLAIPNGIRLVEIRLNKHIPFHVVILGQRVLVSYDGQPFTCFGCSEEGHLFSACPNRRTRHAASASSATTWAAMVQIGRPSAQPRIETADVALGGGMDTCGGEGAIGDVSRATPVAVGGDAQHVSGEVLRASSTSASTDRPTGTAVSDTPAPVGDDQGGARGDSGGADDGGVKVKQVRREGSPWEGDVELGSEEDVEQRSEPVGDALVTGEWKAAKRGRRRGRGHGGCVQLEAHGGCGDGGGGCG
jgi:hypothetical protein